MIVSLCHQPCHVYYVHCPRHIIGGGISYTEWAPIYLQAVVLNSRCNKLIYIVYSLWFDIELLRISVTNLTKYKQIDRQTNKQPHQRAVSVGGRQSKSRAYEPAKYNVEVALAKWQGNCELAAVKWTGFKPSRSLTDYPTWMLQQKQTCMYYISKAEDISPL